MLKNPLSFKYKHIIWDWNGTILDDCSLCLKIINELLQKYALKKINKKKYLEEFGFPVIDFYKKIGFNLSVISFDRLSKEFIYAYEKQKYQCKLHSWVRHTLNKLKKSGVNHSILSAYSEKPLKEIVMHHGLLPLFSNITGLKNIHANGKLSEGMELIKKINTDKNNILLIGDTIHDFDVARHLGIDCILFSKGHQNFARLKSCGPIITDSLKNLITII